MAGEMFLEDPFGIALIPNWNRVAAALPEFLDDLKDAVEADNKLSREAERRETVADAGFQPIDEGVGLPRKEFCSSGC